MKTHKRSPLKDKPLRNPGQSLEEQRTQIRDDKLMPPMMVALLLLIFAAVEWSRYFFSLPLNPILYSVVAALATGYAGFKLWRLWPQLKALRLGHDGEKAVGQYLERLREDGYQVFHDLIGTGFNIDHVVIGPAGVFTIETKTISKPEAPNAKVYFDGERILVNGYELERNPVIQARAQAAWLRELLKESAGREFKLKSVVLFPGWFVEQPKSSSREIWVLEPKALRAFLQHEPPALVREEISLASFHISRFIRTTEANLT